MHTQRQNFCVTQALRYRLFDVLSIDDGGCLLETQPGSRSRNYRSERRGALVTPRWRGRAAYSSSSDTRCADLAIIRQRARTRSWRLESTRVTRSCNLASRCRSPLLIASESSPELQQCEHRRDLGEIGRRVLLLARTDALSSIDSQPAEMKHEPWTLHAHRRSRT